jgi:hypothetical protein
MREAVEMAYHRVVGEDAVFLFSGWGAELTESERAAFEDRLPTAPESSSPLDLEAIRARYDDYCERSLNEDDVFDAAMQCADDVPALLAALEEAQRERDELRRKVADYENAITWDVTCFRCAAQLDALYADTVRRETAESALAASRADNDRMRDVLEKARAVKAAIGDTMALSDAYLALTVAVDTYESQESTDGN